jgi:PilZ domain
VAGPGHSRKVIRFPVEAPIAFWWVDSGVVKRSEGRTRDVSESGAFVFASKCPPPGIQVGFNVFLPVVPGLEHKTRVEADGQVLRVEHARGREQLEGFAILTEHVRLRVNSEMYERGENALHDPQWREA